YPKMWRYIASRGIFSICAERSDGAEERSDDCRNTRCQILCILHFYILDSERSDECIDFTMMLNDVFFFFCVSVYTRTCRNNASISNCGGGFL
ncbi:Uncharacterized protein FWK35_00010997, partial [Aphis craccivora]